MRDEIKNMSAKGLYEGKKNYKNLGMGKDYKSPFLDYWINKIVNYFVYVVIKIVS